jgi:hypothetical protein
MGAAIRRAAEGSGQGAAVTLTAATIVILGCRAVSLVCDLVEG